MHILESPSDLTDTEGSASRCQTKGFMVLITVSDSQANPNQILNTVRARNSPLVMHWVTFVTRYALVSCEDRRANDELKVSLLGSERPW